MRHQPRQARSIASTERMLAAAEQLLREGGADAVTVDAVIARAGTSTGAFYSRFDNRAGLLEAMHERFTSAFASNMADVAQQALTADSLRSALATFINSLFAGVRTHRDTIAFHMLVNAHNPAMRAQGNQTTQRMLALIEQILSHHETHDDPYRVSEKADFVVRILMGLSLNILIFDDDEVTGRDISLERWDAEALALVMAYLESCP
jgi:AcrR family transcriptional regulator